MAKEFFAAICPDPPATEIQSVQRKDEEIEAGDYFSWKAESNERLLSEFLDVRGQNAKINQKNLQVSDVLISDRCTIDD